MIYSRVPTISHLLPESYPAGAIASPREVSNAQKRQVACLRFAIPRNVNRANQFGLQVDKKLLEPATIPTPIPSSISVEEAVLCARSDRHLHVDHRAERAARPVRIGRPRQRTEVDYERLGFVAGIKAVSTDVP
jgi:hypothetical protein